MTQTVIQIEQLGKRYRLGEREPYRALRDVLAGAVRAPFGRRPQGREADGTFWALRDLSLEIREGEIVGIIGRNGAGKSTLLKILSRVTRPTEGHVRIRGRVGSLLEVGTGFHPELSGRENIFLNGTILGMRRGEIARKFDDIVEFAEVEKFIDTPVKHYSSGMYTRLAFAVAAHLEPEILLVDEVLAVGDAAFQKKSLGKIGEVASSGRTVLFVSHNMAAIQNLCTSGYMLERGRVIASGSIESVIARYLEFSQAYRVDDLRERPDRKGSGRLRFVGFAARGPDGQVMNMCGAPTTWEIPYEADSAVANVHVSVGVYNLLGEACLYLSNDLTGGDFAALPQTGTLTCRFDRLPLLPGTYMLNLFATVNGVMADWVTNAVRIDVEQGDFYGTGKLPPSGYGVVLADHAWNVRGQE